MIFAIFTLNCTPIKTTIEEDTTPQDDILPVVIIGGGASGMSAAIRLLELGIEPLILEKESTIGGAGIHAGRFFAVNTILQSNQNITDSLQLAAEDWKIFTGSEADQNVTQFLSQSAETLSWIESFDVEFDSVQSDIGAGSVPRIHTLSDTSPHPLAVWEPELRPYSKINHTVIDIEDHSDFFVVTTSSQSFKTNNIILATGGFARNETIVTTHTPAIEQHDWHMESWFGMTGDSIQWLESLSIPLQNMHHVGLYAHGVTDVTLGFPEVMVVPALERSLILNQDGIRTFNEHYTQSLYGGQLMLQEEALYAIFDAPLWNGTQFQGMGYNYDSPPVLTGSDYAELGTVYQYNDLRDLAQALEMEVSIMMNSIATYNTGIQEQQDAFDKDVSTLPPLQTPPFYAIKLQLSTGKSFGGATVNSVGESTVNNIYVVGESSGFLGTPQVGWGFSGSITACYYLGKQAAEQIAATY